MNVCLTFPRFNRRAGIERVALEAANFLAENGHGVSIVCYDCESQFLAPNIGVHRLSAPRMRLRQLLSFAREAADATSYIRPKLDVVASFGIQSPPGSVTWVQSVHKAWIETSRAHRARSSRLRQIANPFHPIVLAMENHYYRQRRYKRLIALTEDVKSDLVKFYNIPEEDIDVVPNGYSAQEFNVDAATRHSGEIRKSLGIRDSSKVIIFVANELERKGFQPLLDAIEKLNDARLVLLVVGNVSPRKYKEQIARLGADRVRFLGPSSNVADYYAAADVFALPTQYEAWGLVIVEALACGLPVLTSRLAGASIAVKEPDAGLLLDNPRDVNEIATKLRRLIDAPAASRKYISESVRPYAWDQILPRYERILLDNCNRPASEAMTVNN